MQIDAERWAGIDVSRDSIDVVVLEQENKIEQFRCERETGALEKMAERLLAARLQGVVLEATERLEIAVIQALVAAGLAVMRVDPKRARDFARAQGLPAKTDTLALFGARIRPPFRAWPEAERQQLAAWAGRAQELTALIAEERTRLDEASDPMSRKSLQRMIAQLGEELERVEREAAACIERGEN